MEDIEAFLAVIEGGSQTAAARHLGRSLQSVNRSLLALERRIGVELIRRTTRRSFATEAGQAFYRRVKPAFTEIREAHRDAMRQRAEPSGLLRIAAPVQFASAFVVPAAPASCNAIRRSRSTSGFRTGLSTCWATVSISQCESASWRTRR